jgi:hypothetical protein
VLVHAKARAVGGRASIGLLLVFSLSAMWAWGAPDPGLIAKRTAAMNTAKSLLAAERSSLDSAFKEKLSSLEKELARCPSTHTLTGQISN